MGSSGEVGGAYEEAGTEAGARLALREHGLRRLPNRHVGAERVGEAGVVGPHVASGERHAATHGVSGGMRWWRRKAVVGAGWRLG